MWLWEPQQDWADPGGRMGSFSHILPHSRNRVSQLVFHVWVWWGKDSDKQTWLTDFCIFCPQWDILGHLLLQKRKWLLAFFQNGQMRAGYVAQGWLSLCLQGRHPIRWPIWVLDFWDIDCVGPCNYSGEPDKTQVPHFQRVQFQLLWLLRGWTADRRCLSL